MHHDGERLGPAAGAAAPYRGGAEVVQPHRHPHMGLGGTHAIGGIECDPSKIRDEGLGPGVAGLLTGHAVIAPEVTANIARRYPEAARGRNEDVSQILAYA